MASDLRALLALVALASACGSGARERFTPPAFADGGLLRDAVPASRAALAQLSGVHGVEGDAALLGDDVVVRAAGDRLSIFARPDATYAVLRAGCRDGGDTFVLEGYYRRATTVASGLVRLFAEPETNARALCRGEPAPAPIELAGTFDDSSVRLRLQRGARDPSGRFFVVAHRGGCRTIDDCGASENSLEVLRLADALGADAVEVDVQLTSDGVPILYHDDQFDPRLASGAYCRGRVADFTMAHVQALCRLAGGERVPTLDDAFRTVVDETTLRGVWLDVKSVDVLGPASELAARHWARAKAAGRDVTIAVGLPTTELIDAWRARPAPSGPTCLAELEASDAIDAGCGVWAPRWTRGLLEDDARRVREHGGRVAYWTLDEEDFIDTFLGAHPDALLTNRPGLVRHRFESIGVVP